MTPGQHFARLRAVWQACMCDKHGLLHPAGLEAMENLKQFCGFDDSPFNSDPLIMARNVGRQEAVKHILGLLSITDDQLAAMDATVSTGETGGFGSE